MSEMSIRPPAISSGEYISNRPTLSEEEVVAAGAAAPLESDAAASPLFEVLASPALPRLERKNRARLQMQSPNRLHFYWTVGPDPFKTLSIAVPGAENYTLVMRLRDMGRDAEELHPVEAEGSWWFHVEADSEYIAEIGFYAPNRPFVRILASNSIVTPRKSPSPRMANEAQWRVPSDKFAQVLDAAGFEEDAYDIAAGIDAEPDRDAAMALSLIIGRSVQERHAFAADVIWRLVRAFAGGATLEKLRFETSPALFAILQERVG
ncbi:MAG TPA: DUF4912 domain-containing protein, partial [Pyrinomonadaceae bacterium]|nr:DUF4912 domain-containing protein [Pyrinomonadaceae bacterium]